MMNAIIVVVLGAVCFIVGRRLAEARAKKALQEKNRERWRRYAAKKRANKRMNKAK